MTGILADRHTTALAQLAATTDPAVRAELLNRLADTTWAAANRASTRAEALAGDWNDAPEVDGWAVPTVYQLLGEIEAVAAGQPIPSPPREWGGPLGPLLHAMAAVDVNARMPMLAHLHAQLVPYFGADADVLHTVPAPGWVGWTPVAGS